MKRKCTWACERFDFLHLQEQSKVLSMTPVKYRFKMFLSKLRAKEESKGLLICCSVSSWSRVRGIDMTYHRCNALTFTNSLTSLQIGFNQWISTYLGRGKRFKYKLPCKFIDQMSHCKAMKEGAKTFWQFTTKNYFETKNRNNK